MVQKLVQQCTPSYLDAQSLHDSLEGTAKLAQGVDLNTARDAQADGVQSGWFSRYLHHESMLQASQLISRMVNR